MAKCVNCYFSGGYAQNTGLRGVPFQTNHYRTTGFSPFKLAASSLLQKGQDHSHLGIAFRSPVLGCISIYVVSMSQVAIQIEGKVIKA